MTPVQLMLMPDSPGWQGALLCLGDDGVIYEARLDYTLQKRRWEPFEVLQPATATPPSRVDALEELRKACEYWNTEGCDADLACAGITDALAALREKAKVTP